MPVSQDELMYLQSQLEGLESIFIELMPFGVELKRQQVQDFYDKRYDYATKPNSQVAENELRRQFNTKANQVRNLVDSAESLGDVSNKVNLIRAAASLPGERSKGLKPAVMTFCKSIVFENRVDPPILSEILQATDLTPVEARMLLASTMFTVGQTVEHGGEKMLVRDLLAQIIGLVRSEQILPRNDPFLNESLCSLDAMEDEQE
ncbi:MAG TPA: hypothetical protein V6D17_09280 [Candidatus Obscuribacterales bacterium]